MMFATKPILAKQHAAKFYRLLPWWISMNIFQIFPWGIVETGLFVGPIYWLTGLRKDAASFLLFWLAAYLLNLCAAVIFKICAAANKMGTAAIAASLVQVMFLLPAPLGTASPPPNSPGCRRRKSETLPSFASPLGPT